MADKTPPALPGWIHKRDGRQVPFEPDKISQALFAATEELGQANAFLARELTESVLHFIAQEHGEGNPTSTNIAELVAKVVRELGQPALAQAYARRHLPVETKPKERTRAQSVTVSFAPRPSPVQFLDQCARQYSTRAIFSRDLVAAQDEGWLTLLGLEHPAELEGGVLDWPGREGRSLLAALLEARKRFGGFVALDSPEHALETGPSRNRQIALFVRDLREGLEATRLRAIVNLNAAVAPPWAWQPSDGPLFQVGAADTFADRQALLDNLLEAILDQFPPRDQVRLDWHLGDDDFTQSDKKARLTQVVRRALEDPQVSFVFDRPDRPVRLAEGLDRQHLAVLQVIGLHLAPLMDMPGVDSDVELLLQKLFNLARMAASAGAQKRAFVRQLDEKKFGLRRGFFLDRARLVAIPVGIPGVVQRVTNQSIAGGKQGLILAKQILQRLHKSLQETGRSGNLDGVVDNPWWTERGEGTGPLSSPHLVGLTSADLSAPAEEQLRAAGSLHQVAASGTATVLLPHAPAPSIESLVNLLHFAWKRSEVNRVRLSRLPSRSPETPDLLTGSR